MKMTRCEEFYDAWRKDPNWCEKSPGAVSQINAYIKFLDQLEEDGIPQSFTIVNLPEGVARPLVSIRDPTIKDQVLEKVKTSLKAKQKYKDEMKKGDPDCGSITVSDIKSIISSVSPTKPVHSSIIPIINTKPKINVDRTALIGSVIVEWEFPHSITVQKNKKKYEINFDAYSGEIEVIEV